MFRLGVEVCQIFPVHLEIFWISGRSWMKKTADNRLVTSGLSWSNHYQTPHLLLRSPKRTLARSIAAFGHQQHRPTADAAGGVGVFPLNGPSMGRVGIDVTAEFASQVGNRGEDASSDDLAFDLSEPDLDLIEPGRVSGREVKPDARVLLEKLTDGLSFVRGEIAEDDVNLLPRRAHMTSCQYHFNWKTLERLG